VAVTAGEAEQLVVMSGAGDVLDVVEIVVAGRPGSKAAG
jgi:hypothetical protein